MSVYITQYLSRNYPIMLNLCGHPAAGRIHEWKEREREENKITIRSERSDLIKKAHNKEIIAKLI